MRHVIAEIRPLKGVLKQRAAGGLHPLAGNSKETQ